MGIILLVVAVVFWLIAGIPGIVQIPLLSGRVDFGWAGMFLFGLWLLLGGADQLLAFVRRPRT